MSFHPGLDIQCTTKPLGFTYGATVKGPVPELRTLDAIRPSLKDPQCAGPDPVYAISMDVRRAEHEAKLHEQSLLFGVVTYAAGRLGNEPVRSQGHIHKVSSHSGWSPPELYEIWSGVGIIYMQEKVEDRPGRCFAIKAGPGERVVVPPGWGHATISADPTQPLTFGAWCDREYGFDYKETRARGGLAYFPVLDDSNQIRWQLNPRYEAPPVIERGPRRYAELGLDSPLPIYTLWERNPDQFQWVSKPELKADLWPNFEP